MNIIEATDNDIFMVQSLSAIIWPVTFADILTEKQIKYMMDMMYSTESLLTQINELGHQYLLVKDNDEYYGYLSYQLDYKGSLATKIHKIYVLPSMQSYGIGSLLINEVTGIALNNNNNKLSLNVNRNNKAIGFYKKIGFTITDKEDIDIGNGYLMEDFIMEKKL